jgi:hypothetical protein
MLLDSVPERPSRALEAEMRAAEKGGDALLKQVSSLARPGLRRLNSLLRRAKLPVVEPVELEPEDAGPMGFPGEATADE